MPSVIVADLQPAQLRSLLTEHGTVAAVAAHLNVPSPTLRGAYNRLGINPGQARGPRNAVRGNLTREALQTAMQPQNNCAVRAFLDKLDDEQREIVEEALAYDKADLSATGLRDALIAADYDERFVPGASAINNHRSGTRPCRCKG